ncbi:DUF222 domain-containing protein [Nocardia sp. CDC153]|uniref:DUF222 domain-containing protein n=1 Tax=Nocardia sp. CDC153 TaxID=3112167 RepID=UPI002DB67AC1|nr:DUF222 domain-containing protein [Nocardia sp. CDC153]MEC3952573.1 DUF222 domain-containing protein [Nocardia sp. CDC153]
MFDSREVEAMGDEELIDALRRAHGAAAFAQAAEITAVREVYRRHRAENAAPGAGGVRAGEFAAAEIAVAVHVSEAVATALVDIALALDSLPDTKLAFAAGRIDLSRVQVIVDSLRGLPREMRDVLEPKLIEAALRSDPARLRQTAQRWVTRLDPDGETRRRQEREQDRDIRIRAVQDGMAVFDGLLPAAGAQAVAMRLREMSLQVCDDDPRTMSQRRADALIALADGSGRLICGCGKGTDCPKATAPATPRRPLIQVGVSAESLLGLRDDPAFLSGYGPVDATLARTLAEHARFQVIPEYFPEHTAPSPPANEPAAPIAPWERAAMAREQVASAFDDAEPIPGVDRGRLVSLPASATGPTKIAAVRPFSGAPAREIRALDALCRFPGCTIPAAETALIQFDPLPGQTTAQPNAAYRAVLCTHHQRLKSLADKGKHPWRVYLADNDRMRWIDPSGEPHETFREGARYLFPHTDIDAPTVPRPAPLRAVPDLTEIPPARGHFTTDLAYPTESHILIHPQLSRTTPDNDIPDKAATR